MTEAQKRLSKEIEKIQNEETVEKLRIYVLGILTQQGLEESQKSLEAMLDGWSRAAK